MTDKELIDAVWKKGKIVPNYDQAKFRKDDCDAWMIKSEYGNRNSAYGWEIDHISPDGGDSLSNFHPLQWENNLDKSDGRLKCNVIARDDKNERKE